MRARTEVPGSGGRRRGSVPGFSLLEMVIASALFGLVVAVGLVLFAAAQRSSKLGENLTDQQQTARVAVDRIAADLRLAGFNYNPDGDPARVDEPIEGAWDTAITFRGDFDFDDAADSVTPETDLSGAAYSVVSTGNDEIVTYVLARDERSDSETLALSLDADRPRMGRLATVIIPGVSLAQVAPPYTLYRVTLTGRAGRFPPPPQARGAFVYEPVADNIRSMTFRYYTDGGVLLSPDTPGNVADDIGGAESAASTRRRIRRIRVDLTVMTSDADSGYVDATDSASASRHFRKFELGRMVNARNLGLIGTVDSDRALFDGY